MLGRTLGGRYEIMEKIGSGGMADVYKAYCTKLNRNVAVKVLKPQFSEDKEFVSRFELESQAAASLSHNNIVAVHDVGVQGDIHYIVMEYVEGVTLKKYIEIHGMLPWRQVLNFSVQICDAMDHAHKKGIVHRDIKPQNIMVTSDNALKVMDFGIARTANKDITTDNNTAIGTVHYISPEQARGGYVDTRSDIYSMGVVMYEMLTGRVPFDGETAVSIAIMHMQNTPTPPRDLVLSVPYEMEAICLKAMSKEQASRYEDAGAMLADLKIAERENDAIVTEYKSVEEYEEASRIFKEEASSVPVEHRYREEGRKKETKVKNPQQRKSDKKATVILGIASVLIVAVFAAIFYFALRGGNETGLTIDKYPNLVGRKLSEVQEMYEDDKNIRIIVDKDEVESVEYAKGYIAEQSPEAGDKVTTKKITITVTVSKGSADGLSEVPDFVGKHFEDAVKTLDKYDIEYKIVPEEDENEPEGYVLSQTPKAKKALTAKTKVTLYVNMKEDEDELKKVPKIQGLDHYDAQREVENAGFVWGTVTEEASDLPKGTVISQSPAAHSEVKKGYRVNVVISSGKSEEKPDEEPPEVEQPQMNTVYMTVNLPTDRENVNVSVKIDGNVIHEQSYNTSSGTVDIRLTSHGTKNVEVYFDGVLSNSQNINFDE